MSRKNPRPDKDAPAGKPGKASRAGTVPPAGAGDVVDGPMLSAPALSGDIPPGMPAGLLPPAGGVPGLRDLHIPLSSQAVFWRPRHPTASPLLGQLPVIFWLMETLRPQSVVQIGLGDGLVYMALCQAVERLGASTGLVGLQAAGDPLPPAMAAEHDRHYTDFSTLLRGEDPDTMRVAGLDSDAEIDLLVVGTNVGANVGAAAGPTTIAALREHWLPRLSARGVLVLCDPDNLLPDAALRQSLLSDIGPSMVFGASGGGSGAPDTGRGGLALVLHGTDVPERLAVLLAQRPGKPAYLAARRVFNRLGEGLETAQRAADLAADLESALAEARDGAPIRAQQGGLTEAQDGSAAGADHEAAAAQAAARAHLEVRVAELRQALEERLGDIAALTAENVTLHAARDERDALVRDLTALRATLAEAQEKRSAHWARVEALTKERSGFEDRIAGALAAHEARLVDIVALSQERDATVQGLEARIAGLGTALAEAQADCASQQARAAALADENARLRASTSWRVTRPIRVVKRALTGQSGEE